MSGEAEEQKRFYDRLGEREKIQIPLNDIHRITLNPGEVLLVTLSPQLMDPHVLVHITQQLKDIFGNDNKVLIVPKQDMHISKVIKR